MNRWLIFFVVVLPGCAEVLERVPAETTPSWLKATPAEVGLDGDRLKAALAALPSGHGLRSFLVIRHGKLVSETYWNGADADTLQDLRSATKSITSLLVGVAIADGAISGTGASIGEHLEVPVALQPITVGDLLTMRSGLACDDRDPASPGHEDTMYGQRDWVSFLAGRGRRSSHRLRQRKRRSAAHRGAFAGPGRGRDRRQLRLAEAVDSLPALRRRGAAGTAALNCHPPKPRLALRPLPARTPR
jgi:CubicO group peptidase (beta-lactamase class C family)